MLYGERAVKLGVSKGMLSGRLASDGINIVKLISSSTSPEDFRRRVIESLDDDRNTDYLHFSLIMGLYFGCFNLYNYMYICPDDRKKIVGSSPSRSDTMYFIKKYWNVLCEYFSDKYGIKPDELKKIISQMLFIVDSDDVKVKFYNNDIVKDIGKILMGVSLSNEFIGCREAIEFFDESNKNNIRKIN